MPAKKKPLTKTAAKPEPGKAAMILDAPPSLPEEAAEAGERKPTFQELMRRERDKALTQAREKAEAGIPLTAADRRALKEAAEAEAAAAQREQGSEFSPGRAAERFGLYWVNGDGTNYFVRNAQGGWIRVTKERVEQRMMAAGVLGFPTGSEVVSQVQQVLQHVEDNRVLSRAMEALAGYPAGVHEVCENPILVLRGPRLITPKKGEWPMIENLLFTRLHEFQRDMANDIQYVHFCAWLRRAILNLSADVDVNLQGRILAMAGEPGCGKSFIQHFIITPLLGGLSADPQSYLAGTTDFNEEWIGATHLLMEDPETSSRMHDKVEAARRYKMLAVASSFRAHAKRVSAFTVKPKFRVSLSFNCNPEAMRFFPPLSSDFVDKLLFLRLSSGPMPRVCESVQERAQFIADLQMELPAFAWWLLNEFEVPEGWDAMRLGQPDYVNPHIRLLLSDDSPAAEFLALIDGTIIRERTNAETMEWTLWGEGCAESLSGEEAVAQFRPGSAQHELATRAKQEKRRLWLGNFADLQTRMVSEGANYRAASQKLISHVSVPKMLGQIAHELCPQRFVNLGGREKRWLIMEPAQG